MAADELRERIDRKMHELVDDIRAYALSQGDDLSEHFLNGWVLMVTWQPPPDDENDSYIQRFSAPGLGGAAMRGLLHMGLYDNWEG